MSRRSEPLTPRRKLPVPNGSVFPMAYGIAARFKRLCGLQVLALEPSGDQQPVPQCQSLLHVAHQPRLQIDEEQRPRNVSCAEPLQLPWGQKVTVAWVGAQTCGRSRHANRVCRRCAVWGLCIRMQSPVCPSQSSCQAAVLLRYQCLPFTCGSSKAATLKPAWGSWSCGSLLLGCRVRSGTERCWKSGPV